MPGKLTLALTCPAELTLLYSTGKEIHLLQVGPKGSTLRSSLVLEWPENIHLQDIDWKRESLYWTNDEGDLLRFTGRTQRKEAIQTGLPGERLMQRPSLV